MRRLDPKIAILVAALLALLLIAYVFSGGGGADGGAQRGNPERLDQYQADAGATDPEQRCGSQATYDLIKRELFRRAAELRGSNQAAYENLAIYSVARVESPRLTNHDEDVGRIECAGELTLDLPPGISAVGGDRSLTADITYVIQGAADGTGQVLTLSNAEALATSLASLSREGSGTSAPQPATREEGGEPMQPAPSARQAQRVPASPPATATPPRRSTPPAPAPPRETAPPRATASPSFNCRNARSRGEMAVCNDAGLASLDRQMANQFYGARSRADPAQRALLERTRGRFLSYRDSCRSDGCIAAAYRDRLREISDIMAGRWRPQ